MDTTPVKKLLIVDDERQIRLGLVEGVRWSDHGVGKVFAAENGQAALELFIAERPDVVISDIRMPGLTGLQLAERIRGLGSDCAVILLTGYADFEFARQAIRNGVIEYLLKPVNLDDLTAIVERVLGQDARSQSRASEPQPYSLWVRNAIDYVHWHYDQSINAERVAEHVQKTPNYFSGVFKREVGVSFSEFLNRYRIKRAMELLLNTNMPIYEVSERVGYSDYKHFVRKFVCYLGETPTAFRRRTHPD